MPTKFKIIWGYDYLSLSIVAAGLFDNNYTPDVRKFKSKKKCRYLVNGALNWWLYIS